jgi:hypothetical protein
MQSANIGSGTCRALDRACALRHCPVSQTRSHRAIHTMVYGAPSSTSWGSGTSNTHVAAHHKLRTISRPTFERRTISRPTFERLGINRKWPSHSHTEAGLHAPALRNFRSGMHYQNQTKHGSSSKTALPDTARHANSDARVGALKPLAAQLDLRHQGELSITHACRALGTCQVDLGSHDTPTCQYGTKSQHAHSTSDGSTTLRSSSLQQNLPPLISSCCIVQHTKTHAPARIHHFE